MSVTVLVGCQWGDEGKGKIVDILAERCSVVARYQGGANAGHTVVLGDDKYVLHLLPTGILRPTVTCLLGNGMVIDPDAFGKELAAVREAGFDVNGRLFVSPRAHVVLPYHKAVEWHRETTWSKPIGTTLRGIGPAYETKAMRIGLRVGDLYRPERLRTTVAALRAWAAATGCPDPELPARAAVLKEVEGHAAMLEPFVRDVRRVALDALAAGADVLLEGAQGALLDQDHGTYPFVTSSSTSAGGAALGVGLPPGAVDRVVGVTKAYTTRVGEGPFPTEFEAGEHADAFRDRAGEFGATTGRPRRCGWLDGPLLRYACELNGVTALVVTKLDVLDGMESIRIATSYEGADTPTSDPFDSLADQRPIYESLPGWTESTKGATNWSDLPPNAQAYVKRVEAIAGVPVAMVSTGNQRDHVITLREALIPERVEERSRP